MTLYAQAVSYMNKRRHHAQITVSYTFLYKLQVGNPIPKTFFTSYWENML